MWAVYEHCRVDKQLTKAPIEVQKRYEKWKDIVSISGPAGLKLIRCFHDEALRGEWQGFPSSLLNLQYRVIYGIEGENLMVQVVEVTAHDYMKK